MINEINNNIINEVIFLINRNYFLNIHNLLLLEEAKQKELTFLQRKREEDHFKIRIKNDFAFQNEINFEKSNSNEKIANIKQKSESRNAKNNSQSEFINFEVNSYKKSFDEASINPNPKESNKININTDGSSINNNSFTKIKYFNVIKNISNKCKFDSSNNNEIKVLKNKKAVYINTSFLNSYSNSRALKKLKKNKFIIRNKTSSKYRGVSKNGNNWQALIMINNKKYYIGSYPSEEMAARVYDIFAIKNRGIKARTNFIYNNIQKNIIKESKINIKSDNISDFIKQLIN
jgi:hypothetical protein